MDSRKDGISFPSDEGGTKKNRSRKKEFRIDYQKLEVELSKELESEKRYRLQNDAKIRAVTTVGTYEDFKQIVLAAHLTPLDPQDKDHLQPGCHMNSKVVWNKDANNPTDNYKAENSKPPTRKLVIPKNIQDFASDWRILDREVSLNAKFKYLQHLLHHPSNITSSRQKSQMEVLFENEVPVDILPSIFNVFWEIITVAKGSVTCIIEILHIIGNSKRFKFNLTLLTSEELQTLENICDELETLPISNGQCLSETLVAFRLKVKSINQQ